jgi:ABC-type Fe3+-siderophore transport system permease subunit
MTFEAYSVAVRMRLVDMVTPALGLIASMRGLNTDTEAAKRSVADLEKRLQSIKTMTLIGAGMAGAGAYGLSLFKAPLEEAQRSSRS